jgi:hypothetical protein
MYVCEAHAFDSVNGPLREDNENDESSVEEVDSGHDVDESSSSKSNGVGSTKDDGDTGHLSKKRKHSTSETTVNNYKKK